jgi:[ribosomal protein S18]-alanine N-acetyltransferase
MSLILCYKKFLVISGLQEETMKTETLACQKAGIRDFLDIARLDREAWTQSRHSEHVADGEHAWRLWVEHALVYVAKTGETVQGTIIAFPCASGMWCVHKFFIAREFRGTGVGSRLFDLMMAEMDAMDVVCFLTVDPVNESAIHIYERRGFLEKRFVSGYYRDVEDRYVLTRRPGQGSGLSGKKIITKK